jgi:DNA-binding response OmpR family regulator
MNKTALIIDDEPDYCSLLSAILEQDGWRVFQAWGGRGRNRMRQVAST